jgi:hypothetical protein
MKSTTPIEKARNLGPVSAQALTTVGIQTVEELKKLGWEEAGLRVMHQHPRFIHLNMLRALIGACLECDFRNIPESELLKARSMLKLFKDQK